MADREWCPPLSAEEIRRNLGGEPWAMRPWEMDQLDRDTVFAVYLRPRKRSRPKPVTPTFRELWLAHGRRIGHTWLQSEAAWQARHGAGR